MTKRSLAYWEGAAAGLAAGLIAGLVWPKLFSAGAQPSAHKVLQAVNHAPEETKSQPFVSRRDGPESAGDPALVTGVADKSDLEFRLPGAPGPRSGPERLMMPGRPGQELDPGRKVRVAARTVGLGRKPGGRKKAI